MSEPNITERRDQVFKFVNRNPALAMPVYDDPVDRVLGVEVAEVYDLIKDLTLWEVYKLVGGLMNRDSDVQELLAKMLKPDTQEGGAE